MTDNEIKTKLQEILTRMHAPGTGAFDSSQPRKNLFAFKTGTVMMQPHNDPEVTERRILDAKKNATFTLSGQEIIEGHFASYVGCTGLAKAFLYAARDSGLDLRAVITTRADDLEHGAHGHVLPAVKMSDGKYHMIEPRIFDRQTKKVNMIEQPAIVGTNCRHVLRNLENTDYRIMKIITADQLEEIKTQAAIKAHSRQTTITSNNNQRE